MSYNKDCIVGATKFTFDFINIISIIGLWFIVGLIPFGFGYLLFFIIDKYFLANYFLSLNSKIKDTNKNPKALHYIFTLLLIPLPIFIYDLLFCY